MKRSGRLRFPPFHVPLLLAVIWSFVLVHLFTQPSQSEGESPGETLQVASGSPFLLLSPSTPSFYHHEFAQWTLQGDTDSIRAVKQSTVPWTVWISTAEAPFKSVGELGRLNPEWDEALPGWRGRWPIPWNAPDGTYRLCVDTTSWPGTLPPVRTEPFQVISRPLRRFKPGFGVLTLENLVPLDKISGPDGRKHLGALAEWAEFIGADAVFIQGGESSGYTAIPSEEFPWHIQPDSVVRALGEECHQRGVKLGVYVLSFMIGGPPQFSPRYQYGWNFEKGRVVNGLDLTVRRGVSLLEPKRPLDIVKVLRRWQAMGEVDYLGLDYIRPVFGGYELVDDFIRDMPGVKSLFQWDHLNFQERMLVLAQNTLYLAPTAALKSLPRYILADQFFWYRAHRTAGVVQKVMRELGPEKPVWAFTLSWQKGWEHGQDPIMMRDAGIDFDAIMLYEADSTQFRNLVRQWGEYARSDELNLIVGDAVDWPLHQRTLNPSGPEDFMSRTLLAVDRFHKDHPVRGVFVHDLWRALHGRLGPYSTQEWMLAGGAIITQVRKRHQRFTSRLEMKTPAEINPGHTVEAWVSLEGLPPIHPSTIQLFSSPDLVLSPRELSFDLHVTSAPVKMRWDPGDGSAARGFRPFIAARAPGVRPGEPCQINIAYLQGQGASIRRPQEAEILPAPTRRSDSENPRNENNGLK